MQSVFSYIEFRECLKEWYLARKAENSSYSYRSMAQTLGINSGSLSRILKGERKVPAELLPKLCSLLKLGSVESEYFSLLVQFDHESDSAVRRELYRKIVTIRTRRKKEITALQFDYFNSWHHTVIREMLRVRETFTIEDIKRLITPSPTLPEIRSSLKILINLGLIIEEEKGWRVTETVLTTDAAWQETAVQEYQSQMMNLGIESLDRHNWRDRDISTVSITLAEKDLPQAREILRTAREELLLLEEQTGGHNRVYQCNLQFFPLTQNLDK